MNQHPYPLFFDEKREGEHLVGNWFHDLFDLGNIFSQEIARHNISKSLLSISLPKLNFSATPIILGIIKNIMSQETQDDEIKKDEIFNIEYGTFVKIKLKDKAIIGKFLGENTIKIYGHEIKSMSIDVGKGIQYIPIDKALERVTLIENSEENLTLGKEDKDLSGLNDYGTLHKHYLNSLEQNHLNKIFKDRFLIIGEKNKIKNEVLTKFYYGDIAHGYLSDIIRIQELRHAKTSYVTKLISDRDKSKKVFQNFEYIILEGSNAIKNNLEITNMSNVVALLSPQETNYLDTVNLLNDFYQRHSSKKHEFEILENLNFNIPAQLSIHDRK